MSVVCKMYLFFRLSSFLMHLSQSTYLVVRKFDFWRKFYLQGWDSKSKKVSICEIQKFHAQPVLYFYSRSEKSKLISRSETNPFKTKRKYFTNNTRGHVPFPLMQTKINPESEIEMAFDA